jgi:hypothetical protein
MNQMDIPVATEELWSVRDFAKRYPLPKREENRFLMPFGPVARRLPANIRSRVVRGVEFCSTVSAFIFLFAFVAGLL